MGEGRRGLETLKVLIEADTAAALDGLHAVVEMRDLWLRISRRRPTVADTEAMAELWQRMEVGLRVNVTWMGMLREIAPLVFRIVGTKDNKDS